MTSGDKRVAHLLEEVLNKLNYLLSILSEDERYAEILRRAAEHCWFYVPVIDKELRREVRQISEMTLEIGSEIRSMLFKAKGQIDITMKGQCPFCHGDLVTYIHNDELRLRCKNQTTPKCRTYAWVIGTAKRVSPP